MISWAWMSQKGSVLVPGQEWVKKVQFPAQEIFKKVERYFMQEVAKRVSNGTVETMLNHKEEVSWHRVDDDLCAIAYDLETTVWA